MTTASATHLSNREWMASALASEIFGPGRFPGWKNDLFAASHEIEPTRGMELDADDFYKKRHVRLSTGEEILKDEAPSKRYGVGLLFPREKEEECGPDVQSGVDTDVSEEAGEAVITLPEDATKEELLQSKKLVEKGSKLESLSDDVETDLLGLARLRRPRSMGISFVADASCGRLRVDVSGGRYLGIKVNVRTASGEGNPYERKLWVRIPATAVFEFDPGTTDSAGTCPLDLQHEMLPDLAPLQMKVDVRIRSVPASVTRLPGAARLVTITIVNDTQAGVRANEEEIFFQSRFSVSPVEKEVQAFLPLPRSMGGSDAEEQSLALLYRNSHSFAMGHGCAGDWEAEEGKPFAAKVIAEPMPFHETPPVTPDLTYPQGHAKAGQKLVIRMLPLAQGDDSWMNPMLELADLYDSWIAAQKESIPRLEPSLRVVAEEHVRKAGVCSSRMRKGLNLLAKDEDVAKAFKWTNDAILLQQIAGRFPYREISYSNGRQSWSAPIARPSFDHDGAADRAWRPFQIAFLLMSLPGLWDGRDPDREIADLIWFPTGGGKTEAYLAAAAFHLLARRLQDADNAGTGVLMRYTLRLLTSQQFQRAAGLICALEQIRIREKDESGEPILGDKPFRIGIWVGGTTTPNTHDNSLKAYDAAQKRGPEEYKHVMLRCPWCGSEMGPKRNHRRHSGPQYLLNGLRPSGSGAGRKILIHCPDSQCDYHQELPVEVVDEGIYERPPSLIIGTVDKFAMLAWRDDSRSIFGLDDQGLYEVDPPGLIIQDELHLITGPLGSMVGLYEGVIEELCTWRSKLDDTVIRPKLVASTATTRASTRQIRDLYAREHTAVFPPPGLDAGDSFFATYDRDSQGRINPGRMYLGILARGYGSGLTVSVRVFAALLTAARLVPENERDPWYTLLVFYNALRDLGGGLTLFGADIPERLSNLRNRWIPGGQRRYLNHVLELTGRLDNSEIPAALKALERSFPSDKKSVDACLASNIIEVGVDVPRLGLMAVSGQPKNTAQYIQATGRVGRETPGLVVMAYNHSKARDLSHFEHFRDYHARLYAQVEPSSVTPFTVQLLERALHGAFLVWIRNRTPKAHQKDPRDFYPPNSPARQSLDEFADIMRRRIGLLFRDDPAACQQARSVFDRVLQRRIAEWESVTASNASHLAVRWNNNDLSDNSGEMPLLRYYGEPCRIDWLPYTWPTPSSMRGVDAECPAAVVSSPEPASSQPEAQP
jgi:hypothetical protein